MHSTYPVLAQQIAIQSNLKNISLAVLGSLAIWVSAKVQIPFYPVPMTMQLFVILAIGAAFGSRLGAATVLFYLAQGAMGLPVFAGTPEKGIGLAYMAGPTGGFLVGFVAAAFIAGWLSERGWDRNAFTMFFAMLLGTIALYGFGLLWLAAPFLPITDFSGVGWSSAFKLGLKPFIWADLLKVTLASVLFPLTWSWLAKH